MSVDDAFDTIAADLSPLGVTTGMMFGKRALKFGGKAFACTKGDNFAMRLGAGTADHRTALALPEAILFEPCEGKTFKDWVVIPSAFAEQWSRFAELALQRVAG